jgi:hypothetical protein
MTTGREMYLLEMLIRLPTLSIVPKACYSKMDLYYGTLTELTMVGRLRCQTECKTTLEEMTSCIYFWAHMMVTIYIAIKAAKGSYQFIVALEEGRLELWVCLFVLLLLVSCTQVIIQSSLHLWLLFQQVDST